MHSRFAMHFACDYIRVSAFDSVRSKVRKAIDAPYKSEKVLLDKIKMSRSLKAHQGCLNTLRIAIKRNGFLTQRALSERAGYSLATVKKFLGGKPVDFATFTELCETLNLEWEEIAGLDTVSQSHVKPSNLKDPSNLENKSEPGSAQKGSVRSAQDWGNAVDISVFYGRERTLNTLEDWLIKDRCRLIALCGIGGIGKTALSAKLAHRVADRFDCLIWRSLKNAPPIQETLTNLLNFFRAQPGSSLASSAPTENLDAQLRQLVACLRDRRCLIVLDNIESLFEEGDRAGTYLSSYEGYGQLLKTLGETDHHSSILLTSRELPKEVAIQANTTLPIRSFQLSGLTEPDGQTLMQSMGAFTGTSVEWNKLIEVYGGNPLALKVIAAAVRDYFDGSLSAFLEVAQQDSLIFGDVRQLLARQVERLTSLEKEIMYWLSINREAVVWRSLRTDLLEAVPLNEILQAIDSLERRSLVEKTGSRITQQAVIMDYFISDLIEQVCEELRTQQPQRLRTHALVKANSRDYIYQSQLRLILSPILSKLRADWPSTERLVTAMTEMLQQAQRSPIVDRSYVGGNVLTLLHHLGVDLQGYDFSNLAIRQTALQGLTLHNVDFSQSDLSNSTFNQPFGSIRAMTFNPTGDRLATGDTNSEIWLWQAQPSSKDALGDVGSHISTLEGHQNWVCSIAFSPDGKQLASGSADRTLRLWDVETGECLQILEGHRNWVMSVAFSPDGKQLASGSADRTLRVWDVQTGECLQILEGHSHGIWSVAFSPDGKLLASGSADQTIKLWEMASSQCQQTLSGHQHGIWTIAFSPDGNTLASGSADQTVKLWDIASGECQHTLAGHNNWVWVVAFSPDGRSLVSGSADQTIRLWNLKKQQCQRVLTGHSNWVWSVAFSPDGQYLTSGSEDRTMRLWSTESGQCLKSLQGSSNWVWAVAFSPDGHTLASGQGDRCLHLWDMTSKKRSEAASKTLKGSQTAIWSVAFSPDSNLLASGHEEGDLTLWSLSGNPTHRRFSGHTKSVWSVAFNPVGDCLASGSADQSIKLWAMDTGKCRQTLTGHQHWVSSVAFHPQKNLLASGSYDRKIKLWDLETYQCVETWKGHVSGLCCIDFSPQGDFLVSSSIDQTIRLWSLKSQACEQVFMGHENWVMSVAISPDGEWIASGSADRTVRLWNIGSGKLVRTMRGHANTVWSVAFSPDGKILASGSDDKTIRLWSTETGHCKKTLKNKEPYEGMNISGVVGLTPSELSTLEQLGAIGYSA